MRGFKISPVQVIPIRGSSVVNAFPLIHIVRHIANACFKALFGLVR